MEIDIKQDRAWIEVNLENLENNINEIKNVIDDKCKIMAVVKANAYGHGIINVATKLNEIGIQDFAVATLSEGIELRKHNIEGNILILGYTNFKDIEYVIKYDLIQTIVDYEYAKKINQLDLEEKIKAHIKINTGMNRIGTSYEKIDEIIDIYNMKNIQVLGIFSHFCVADSNKKEDIQFTQKQINNFFDCINKIRENGYDTGKIHIQSSYGILNYPEIKCDYVRPGIIMYGNYSSKGDKTKTLLDLKPVLSLKARITTIKEIAKGESVSYGITYLSNGKKKL